MSSASGIGYSSGGIDVAAMVSQLMAVERQPISAIEKRRASAQLQADAVGRLRTSVETLRSNVAALMASGMSKYSPSVSNAAVASATAVASAGAGSLSFTVDRLAAANGMRTGTSVASSGAPVTSAALLAVSSTGGRIGAGAVGVGAGVTAGTYTATVTQATAGARRTGTAVLGPSTVIGPSNSSLGLRIDGVTRTINIAQGTYAPSELAAAVQAGIDAQGGGAVASIDGSGRMSLVTTREGSSATLQVVNANATLGLANDAAAVAGTDGRIRIGTNPEATVTSAGGAGSSVAVSTGTGDLTLQLTGGLRTGSATIAVVSTGDRTLAGVAAAINGANVGASAAAVKVAEGSWLLQVSATRTGTANAVSLDPAAFAGVGGLMQTSAAMDAGITVGSGAGAYSISASGNTFSDVLPGVSLTVSALSSAPVTLTSARDDAAIANAVDGFVKATNSVLADIAMQTRYDPVKKTASPLTGDAGVKRLADQIRFAVTNVVPGVTPSTASQVGITTGRDGMLSFDRTKFMSALEANPAGVQRLFSRGGTGTGSVSYANAIDTTEAGSYAVVVTTAATRATTGTLVSGTPGNRQIGVRMGGVTATYQAPPGSNAAEVAAGLNSAMAAAGVKVTAAVSGSGVSFTALEYGGAGTFEVNTNVDGNGGGSNTWTSYAGNDVAGTIDGRTAIGVGQSLRLLALDTSGARGLEVNVAEGALGAVGTIAYSPGVAARVASVTTNAVADKGTLATSKNSYDTRIAGFRSQIDRFELRMVVKEEGLRRQWSSVQTLLSGFQSQGTWLSQQIAARTSNG